MKKQELVIIGAGPAGLTAAIYGRRAGLETLVLEQLSPGGQIKLTDEIDNWPGTIQANGYDLADSFRLHAEHFKAEFQTTQVNKIRLDDGRKIIETSDGDIEAGAIIVATGTVFKKLGCPGEDEFMGRGISYCAVCDGGFYRNVEVAVVGGGNTAVEEANYLTRFASKVYVVHRRDRFRADRAVVEKTLANPKIVPIYDSVVESIAGGAVVEKLVLKNVKTEVVSELPIGGVFLLVGTSPQSSLLEGLVEMQPGGWVVADSHLQTSVPGIYVAGDVRDTPLRQVVTAAADGAVAAMSSYHYLYP